MSSIRMQLQNAFLNELKRELDHQPGVLYMLWKLSYSFMTLTYCYEEKNKHLLDIHRNEIIIHKNMETETFKLLMKYGFNKNFKIEKIKRKRKLNIFGKGKEMKTIRMAK